MREGIQLLAKLHPTHWIPSILADLPPPRCMWIWKDGEGVKHIAKLYPTHFHRTANARRPSASCRGQKNNPSHKPSYVVVRFVQTFTAEMSSKTPPSRNSLKFPSPCQGFFGGISHLNI